MKQTEPRIFINSLPKAGTNLVSRAFRLAGIEYGKLGIAATLLLGDRYLVRQLLRRSIFDRDPIIVGLDVQVPVRRAWLDQRLSKVSSGNYITGHANWTMGLQNLLDKHGFRTALVVRDPRDVLLSHGHYLAQNTNHFLNRTYSRLDLNDRTQLTLSGGRIDGLDVPPFSVMLNRINAWFERTDVELIRFEDLIGPSGGGDRNSQIEVFEKLTRLTGRHFSPAVMDAQLYGKSHTFRTGQIGSAVKELDRRMLANIDYAMGDIRTLWGYKND